MRALVCKAWGEPETLTIEDMPSPTPGPGQLRVRVEAAGVNFPDVLIVQGKYQFRPDFPFSPGGEIAGVVEEVGEGVTRFKAGDRIAALAGWGGFAEEAIVEAAKAAVIPADLDAKIAASFFFVYGTTIHGLLDRGQLKAGETLLVLGAAGGVGLAAVEIGKAVGATVIAAASSAEKLAACKAHGADHLINYASEDLRARLKEIAPNGPDVVYDPVGGDYAELAFRSIGWRGRYLVVGFAAGGIPKLPFNLPLLKGASIVGVFWGDFMRREPKAGQTDMMQLMTWLSQGKLKPEISGVYSLADAPRAIRHLADRKAVGKLVVEPQR